MSDERFNIFKLYENSKKTLLHPKEYFASMKTQGGLGEPIIKALMYGVIAGIFVLIWDILNLTVASAGLLGGAAGIAGFFGAIISAVIGVFIGG
ncbi:MAG: hypothetical protein R6V23_06625, partial [Bacteroidales bacterium]